MALAVDKRKDAKLTVTSKSIIKASSSSSTTAIPLSAFDLRFAGTHPTCFYVYSPPPPPSSIDTIASAIRSSLSQTLAHFYPFSGRTDLTAARILCNNEGVHFLEASADFPLSTLDFYSLDAVADAVMIPVDDGVLLTLQLTTYTCGGFTLAWTIDHVLCDVFGFTMFLSTFSQISRAQVSRLPVKSTPNFSHDRSALLLPWRTKSELESRRWLELVKQAYTVQRSVDDNLRNVPPAVHHNLSSRKHVYFVVKGSRLEDLQHRASQGGSRRTRYEALVAYIWKAVATSLVHTGHELCKMTWIISGRQCWPNLVDGNEKFVGNLLSLAVREEKVDDLKEKTLAEIASLASTSIRQVCHRDYFMEFRDYLESNNPKNVVPRMLLETGVPGLLINGLHSVPMMDVDFGFGEPKLYAQLPPSGPAFYMNFVSSGREDGSWFVDGRVWPELATALESDPEQFLTPITRGYIFGIKHSLL